MKDDILINFKKNDFVETIKGYVSERDMSYMDAIILYCEERHIDPAYIKSWIIKPFKEKIEAEAISLNYLPKEDELIEDELLIEDDE